MQTHPEHGRINQKRRTRQAIVNACAMLADTGAAVTMPEVARAAGVSEATAYRYFPNLISLLRETNLEGWPDPDVALAHVRDSTDVVERIGAAAEVLMRGVLARQGAIRAVISAAIIDPDPARIRPGYRFALIDHALAPIADPNPPALEPAVLRQLKLDLAMIVSAEALFTLMDLCRLSSTEAVNSAVHAAQAVTRAALREPAPPSR